MALPDFPNNPTIGDRKQIGDAVYECTAILPDPQWSIVARDTGLIPSATLVRSSLKNLRPIVGLTQQVVSFHSGWSAENRSPIGGGVFTYEPSIPKSMHNGGTFIAPEALNIWDGTPAGLPSFLGWTGVGSGCFVRILEDQTVSAAMFGAKVDGITSDTVATQKAFDTVGLLGSGLKLKLVEGVSRQTSTLIMRRPIRLVGEGAVPYVGGIGGDGFGGSWLYFDHSQKGILVDGTGITANNLMSGVSFEHFGTRRNQPEPFAGWQPFNHDFDIWVENADVTLDDLLLLNPTHGFKLTNTNAGRLTIKRLRGQPLKTGIDIDVCYDLPMMNNVHFWPYWRDSMQVHNYTMRNLDGIYLRRVDNPQITNAFTIFARSGIRITQSAAGTVSKLLLTNADFDRGLYGLWIDSTVTSMTASKIVNFSCQGETGLTGSIGVLVQGSNCVLQFENLGLSYHHQNAFRVEGVGNKIAIGNSDVAHWNQSGVGFPAFEALENNTLTFSQPPSREGGNGAPVYAYDPSTAFKGLIYSDDLFLKYTPTVSSQSGTIGAISNVDARYQKRGSVVEVTVDITISNIGTAGGEILFTLPIPAKRFCNGSGRDVSRSGLFINLQTTLNSNVCQMITFNNTFPAVNGSRLVGTLKYDV